VDLGTVQGARSPQPLPAHCRGEVLQLPYFTLGYETQDNRGHGFAFGPSDSEEAGPFAPYAKWHLVSTDGPMHYLANAMYWAGFHEDGRPAAHRERYSGDGDRQPPRWDYVAKTLVLGSVAGDPDLHALSLLPGPALRRFIIERQPKVVEAFKAAMLELFADQAEGVERAFAHRDPRERQEAV
jgi:hypothetical protein